MENWNIVSKIGKGPFLKTKLSFIPIKTNLFIHHSTIPLFQYDLLALVLMLLVGVLVFELTKRNVKSRGLVAGY